MITIPEAFHDLLDGPVVVQLATVMPDGQPQVTPIWIGRNGNELWANTAIGRRKDKNLRNRPMATVAVLDPENPYRWIELRCKVTEIVEGQAAHDHIDDLSQLYFGRGFNFSTGEQRVIFKLTPFRITHSGA